MNQERDNALPLEWRVDVSDLPEDVLEIQYSADVEACQKLARHADIVAVESLAAQGEIRSEGDTIRVRLNLLAKLTQKCVVTLESVTSQIRESIERRYVRVTDLPEPPHGAVELRLTDEDPPETMEGPELDLGSVLTEEFVLALNPYPRAPGVEPVEVIESGPEISPFAVLQKLKSPK